jgi:hypothetical protein
MKQLLTVLAVTLCTQAAGGVLAQSDPFVGTWTLNVEESKFDPGPGPQSQTRTWAADGRVTVEGISGAGEPITYEYSILGDTAAYPTTGAVPNAADMVSSNRIDANTIEAVFSRQGSPTDLTKFMVSDDGKTMTVSAKGNGPDGEPLNDRLVYEKQ